MNWVNVSCKSTKSFETSLNKLWQKVGGESGEFKMPNLRIKKIHVFDSKEKSQQIPAKNIVIAFNSLFFISGILIGEQIILLEILALGIIYQNFCIEDMIFSDNFQNIKYPSHDIVNVASNRANTSTRKPSRKDSQSTMTNKMPDYLFAVLSTDIKKGGCSLII